MGADLVQPTLVDNDGWQVGLREVAVVVRVLLAALGDGYTFVLDPAPGLLRDALAAGDELTLTLLLVLERAIDGAEAVHVLDLYLAAELLGAERADGDVGVAAEVALLHVAGANVEVAKDLTQLDQVGAGFLRRAHIRLADDLHEGDAGAVYVHEAVGLAGRALDVEQLGRVLLQVDAGNTDALAPRRLPAWAVSVDLDL